MSLRISKIGAVILSILMILAMTFSTFCFNAEALDNNAVRHGVVAVVFYLKGGVFYLESDPYTRQIVYSEKLYEEGECSGGSGFFVGNGKEDPMYIVTNHHVVDDYIDAGEGGTFKTYFGYTESGYLYGIGANSCELRIYYSANDYDIAYVDCYGDRNKLDLAVLKLRNPTNKRASLQIAPVSNDNVGDTVYTVGYPGNADNKFTGASKYGEEDSTVHKGSITRIVMNEGKGVERISTDATIQHGNSGGPLVTENGVVVGVNTNVISESPYENQIEADYYSISSNDLMRFLEKNNIPYTKAGSSGGAGILIILLIVSAIIVAVAAIIIIVVVASKKKKVPAGVPAGAAVPAYAAAGAGAPAAAPQNKAVIRSMSAQHNGKAFPVGKAPVVIGRNKASCVIIFEEGTQGVSGVHCSVSYDSANNSFTLTDLNSTYGTFLIGGQKLTPNTPTVLRAGDSFYVGDKANVCRVELVQ